MKKSILIGFAAGMMLAGCMTEQMKSTPFYEGHDVTYTGKAEDRVNLWPLAYWREPVGSVLWPILSFSDDHFAVRPLYSRYDDEHNFLWPLGQYDSTTGDGRVFPIYWGKHHFNIFPIVWNDRDFHSLFPILFYEEEDYLTLFPFIWWDIDENGLVVFPLFGHAEKCDWLAPVYYRDEDLTLITPLFGMNKQGENWLIPLYWHDEDVTWVTPLFGKNKYGDSWLIPFYATDNGDVYSPLWCGGSSGKGTDDENSWWLAPPLLSWGSSVKGQSDQRYLLGMGGYSSDASGSSHWMMPFYYGNSEGTFVTPLYGRTKDSQWTFPLWYRDEDSFASWFWGGHRNEKGELDWWIAPPLLTSGGRDENGARINILTALAGARWDGKDGYRSSWCFPFWYENSDETFITPLYGHSHDASWLAPIYYNDNHDLVTPLWWQSYRHGETGSWMIPPLLTGGGVNDDGTRYFYSPLGGFNGEQSGILPLYYRNEKGFYSLLFCRKSDGGETHTIIPPLLSWYESCESGGSSTRLLLGLYGHDTRSDGSTRCDWLFPLYRWDGKDDWATFMWLAGRDGDSHWLFPVYHYDGRNGDIATLLFGRETGLHSTDWWWLTPLVGHTTGERSGFWFQPFVNWGLDGSLATMEAMMDADTLDKSIVGEYKPVTDWDCEKDRRVTNDVFRVDYEYAGGKLRFGFDLFGTTRSVFRHGYGNERYERPWLSDMAKKAAGDEWREGKERTVTFTDESEFGNDYIFGGKTKRVVNFDYDSKEKVFDGEFGESQALFGLVWSSRDEHIRGGHSYAKRALFWRLWHYEELNGDSTTDMFPFITRDTKKNGYSKTSFLWRFFRYESDPEKGTSIDLFFIPLWRP
ncbi:MAG: hypothetical protein K6F50_09250 [Kiritimatiellae bacterium]|nr:hypothetical protein [Kiritimatiellia bacterium]